jgi:hypothetical protein
LISAETVKIIQQNVIFIIFIAIILCAISHETEGEERKRNSLILTFQAFQAANRRKHGDFPSLSDFVCQCDECALFL